MSRDYAPKPRATRSPRKSVGRRQSGSLSFKWVLSLAAVGGFVGFILYLNSLPAPEGRPQESGEASAAANQKAPAKPENEKPRFQFYEMLPDSEVVPPEVEEYTPGPTQSDFDYIVQTGSFRQREDAERQRAQIAFQGLRASVTEVNLDSGSTWFRVNVGPFESRSQMNSAIDKLVSISIEPLVRKVPKEG